MYNIMMRIVMMKKQWLLMMKNATVADGRGLICHLTALINIDTLCTDITKKTTKKRWACTLH